jgi:hypothetical protein
MRSLSAFVLALASCSGPDVSSVSTPLAVYNAGPSTCDGFSVNSTVPGVYDCRATIPVTEASCPAAQWLWTGEPGGYSSLTGQEKGNAYCARSPWLGGVEWGSYPGPRVAVVQEIGGLWISAAQGCNKNVRVCLGTPTQPAVNAIHGARVLGCGATGATGPGGCAVCSAAFFGIGTPTQNDTCCGPGECLRHTLTVDMVGAGRVVARHGDLECLEGSCAAEYSDIAPVVLTRTDGHVDWTGWEGDCTGTADVCSLTPSGDRTVRAT